MIKAGADEQGVLRAGKGNTDTEPGDLMSVLLNGGDTEGRFAVIETVETNGSEAPYRVHTREDLAVYVVEGQVRFRVDGEWLSRPAGTCVLLPRGCEHTYAVESERARLLTILVPAGFEGYYREMDDRGGASQPATPDFERLVTVAAHYGVEIAVSEAISPEKQGDGSGGDGA
jgi:quercetin dioxygenase-like cupin family protein